MANPDTIEFADFGAVKEIPIDDEQLVAEHLAAQGRKAFVVEECVLQGRFPDWPPQMERIDMPGTNDIDPFRTEVTEKAKKCIAGLMLVTKGTQLGSDIISWFKDTPILAEMAESTGRNQQRLFVVRTVVDDQALDGVPEDAQSVWPYLETHCREQERHFKAQLRQLVRDMYSDEKIVTRLTDFVDKLPVHFVSAKVFRQLTIPALRNRVRNNPYTPANAEMMAKFMKFEDDAEKTGIPKLRRELQVATDEYLHSQFLRRMQSHLEKEVDAVIGFFRRQRMDAELQLAGQAEAYRQIAEHVETSVSAFLSTTEDSERVLGHIKSDFQAKAAEILSHAQAGFRIALQPKQELWSFLHWRTLRAVGYKCGRHYIYRRAPFGLRATPALGRFPAPSAPFGQSEPRPWGVHPAFFDMAWQSRFSFPTKALQAQQPESRKLLEPHTPVVMVTEPLVFEAAQAPPNPTVQFSQGRSAREPARGEVLRGASDDSVEFHDDWRVQIARTDS
ncbi:MAG: hypothetical protein O2960_01200 [Verrucomicrobia bacterium]|nr:hypothetical protein [Verrucomicrobiota bacterium]